MAFREKHRKQAMAKRVEAGRTIKSDLDEKGKPIPAYAALKRSFTSRKAAATRRAAKARAQDPATLNRVFGKPDTE